MVIDVVVLRRRPPNEAGRGIAEKEASRGHVAEVFRRDRHLAGLTFFHEAIGADYGDCLVVDAEARQVRDVALRTIAVVGNDAEGLAGRRLVEEDAGRRHFQAFERRGVGRIIAGALGDPAEEQVVRTIAERQSLTALVRHLAGGLAEKEADGRFQQVQSAAHELRASG